MAVIETTPYGELLAASLPRVIGTEAEHRRVTAIMERLDTLPNPTAEEQELSELLTLVVMEYERRYDLGHASPLDALKELMEIRDFGECDLIPVFGSTLDANDILNARRKISRIEAHQLATLFCVPTSLFI